MKQLSNTEALVALVNGKKIKSSYWNNDHYIQLTEVGIIVSKRGLREEWNELATSLRDSWIIVE